MANRKVSIWLYKKIDGRWRYVKPAIGRNGKIKPDPDAAYYIRYREGGKMVWRKCSSAVDATIARERQEAYFTAFVHGLTPKQQWDKNPPPATMSDVLLPWLEEYRLSHQPESHALMVQTLNEFNNWCRKDIVAKITTVDLLRYRAWLIDKKRSPRTAANKMLRVNQFIRSIRGLREGEGPVSVKHAKFVELEPTVFNDDELTAFFKECDSFRYAIFKCYLMSGLRKAELESLTWGDVDFKAGTIAVSPKPDFTPKDWEQRTVEIPDELLALLKGMPRRGAFVFANGAGHRYTHSWDDCAKIPDKSL